VWNGAAYDCQECGACCTNQEAMPATGYVCLSSGESKRMRRLGLSVVQSDGKFFLGTRTHADLRPAACVALTGEVGGTCRCTIYDVRPSNCRQFEVGSGLCKAARRKAGLPA
jgi:Fe-S-cluster containining protein